MADYKKYFTGLITMSIPIIIGNISHILIGAIDVIVASRHSVDTISAISIANAIMVSLFIIGIGLMSGITPVISNYRGASVPSKKYLLTTINYSQILALIFCFIAFLIIPLIDKIGFEQKLVPIIKEYIFIAAFSNFGGYLHFALKEFLQGYEILAVPNLISVVAIFMNLIFNIIFVFGFGPIPAMGAAGLAVATLLVRTIMGLFMLGYSFRLLSFNLKFDFSYIKQLIKVGYPIAIALMLEFMAFNSITVIVARDSGLYAAAQNIVITITSMTFMVPLAISNAIAIKVGFANGARNYLDLKRYSISGSLLTMCFMSCCAVLLFIFPRQILSLITTDETLLNIGVPVVMVASVFQIFDGLQVAFSGILKGLKMTLFVTVAILGGYWLVGLPLGAFLAYVYNMELVGFWVGLAISLFVMCIFMGIVLIYKFKKLKMEYNN